MQKLYRAKPVFPFPFSACFVRSATGNADAQEYYCFIWTNINPESKFYLCIYLFIILSIYIFIWDFGPFKIISCMWSRSISTGELPGVAT